jgi:hypothetical protein
MKKINVPDLVEVTDDIFNQDNSVFAKVLCKISHVDSPRMFLLADDSVVSKTESLRLKIGKYIKTHSISLL